LAGDGYILLAGVLLVVGLAATALAGRLRLPGLVVLLAVGTLATAGERSLATIAS
jgi:hypothetical protein